MQSCTAARPRDNDDEKRGDADEDNSVMAMTIMTVFAMHNDIAVIAIIRSPSKLAGYLMTMLASFEQHRPAVCTREVCFRLSSE